MDTSSINSGFSGRLGSDFAGGVSGDFAGGGASSRLGNLGPSVADELARQRLNSAGAIDIKAVSNCMSGISGQPIAGMNHSFLV
jgi:hypothetical protein